jgi:DNA-binding XRE family transcriptional regulator
METGSLINTLHKDKDWSQTNLANKIGISPELIGKSVRGEADSYIKAAIHVANTFEIASDYIVCESTNNMFNRRILKRQQDTEKLKTKNEDNEFDRLDSFLAKNILKSILK